MVRYRLAITQRTDGEDSLPIERLFEQDMVRIGRHEVNDLQLSDTRRLVSGRHAELRQQPDGIVLVDVGSKNGTLLNDQPVTVGAFHRVKPDDRISIGDFTIRIVALEGEQPILAEAPAPSVDRLAAIHDVAWDALYRYWEVAHEEPAARREALASALRDGVRGMERDEAVRALDVLSARFADREAQAAEQADAAISVATESSTGGDDIVAARATARRLIDWTRRYVDADAGPAPGESLDAVLDRLERAWDVLLDGLADAVKGRRQFESEFDANSTRIFSWKPNPIKHAESAKDIGAYLLDWRRPESAERVTGDLKEVFTDLALHQMGLMAGFQHSVRGLLERLDPEAIEREARDGAFGIGGVKPFGARAAWEHFKEVHRALSEEEVKTFETVLGPHFIRGYLSLQRKKANA